MNPITPSTSHSAKLNPEEEIDLETLKQIDFSGKPAALRALEEKIVCTICGKTGHLAGACDKTAADPFRTLFILTYKGNGPVEHVFFRSTKVLPLITRDCQVWCKARSLRYISFKPALVNLAQLDGEAEFNGRQIAPVGDISEIVTRQAVAENEKLGRLSQ